MTLDELDKLIEKLDSMSYVYHDMTFWHILGMRDVLKELRKDPNTAETMNLSYLKEHLQSRFLDETFSEMSPVLFYYQNKYLNKNRSKKK